MTVAVAQKAFADAKIYPLDEAEMFSNMYSPFAKLSQAEALECLRIAQGPLREIGQSRIPRGIIWASEVQAQKCTNQHLDVLPMLFLMLSHGCKKIIPTA